MRMLAATVLLIPCLSSAQRQDFTLSGKEVALYNIAGVLRLEGGTGDVARVEVTRGGKDASRLRVEAGAIRGKETLRVIYPDDRVVYREGGITGRRFGRSITRLRVADDGTFGGRGNDWRDGQVEVVSAGDGLEAHADIRVVVPAGQSIDLNLGVGEVSIDNVNGNIRVSVSAANITSGHTKGTLNLDTGSGEVRVTDAEGELSLDTGSGEVTVSRVKGRELKMDTGSGSVTATSIEVERLGLDTGSGRVTLRDVKARELLVDTGSGSVEIDLSSDVDRLAVDSGSGGITIGVPSVLGAELSIETGSGRIDADVPVTVRRSGRRSLVGSIGDGRGRITIETGSGGVRLRASR